MTTDYLHTLREPCPIAGGPPINQSFSDHDRPGVYNACAACHDDKRTMGQRLSDLDAELEREANS